MLKELHLGNIANVAYGYCKILKQFGHQSSLLCYDLDHVLSQPEWMDGDFCLSEVNENCFDPSDMEVKRWSPPSWYQRIKSIDYLGKYRSSDSDWLLEDDWKEALIRFSRRYGKRWALKEEDILCHQSVVNALSVNFFPQHDVIFGYAYAAIPALLSSMLPYVAVEIGTMRDIPFEDNAQGRLLALAYRTASHVIITNPDVVRSARELEVRDFTFVPHPLDEEVYKPLPPEEKFDLHRQYGADFLLLAPARQNWEIKGNDKYLAAFAELVKTNMRVKLLIPAWGQDVEQSRDLVKKLGIEGKVEWLDPMPEMRLVKFYNSVDLVLDQFGSCRTFGLITPKAMACGVPVLLTYDPHIHDWCFNEQPPVIQTEDEKDIFQSLKYYLTHGEERSHLSQRSREWVLKHHSKEVIAKKFDTVIEAVSGDTKSRPLVFDALRQKKLELTYETECASVYEEKYHGALVYQEMDDKLISILREHIGILGLKNAMVLDLGCGPGSLTTKLLDIPGIRLTGVDLSPAMIQRAKRKYPSVDFYVDDAEALSFEDDTFDVVFCSGVLHHFPALDMSLQEIRRVLKPGGILVLREPNCDNFTARFPELAFAHLCLKHYLNNALRVEEVAEPEPHQYHKDFDFFTLCKELSCYFKIIDFYTDLKVAYFYDMLVETDSIQRMWPLEESLEGHPGLNIVMVAKKDTEGGIDISVLNKINEIKSDKVVQPSHFKIMTNFAQSIFENYSAEHYDDLALINSFVDPSILEKMLYKKTLIVSDDKYNYGYIFERYERLLQRRLQEDDKKYFFPVRIWRKIGRKLGLVKAALPISLHRVAIDSFSPEANGKYEIGLVCINRTLTARRLVEIFGTISDYGVILLELENRGAIVEIEEKQLQYLQQFCVLGELMLAPDSKWFLFLGKFLYSAKDFNTALVAALEKEIGRYRSEEKREVEEILAATRERLGMLAENFSVLEKHFIDKRRVGDVLSS